MSVVTDDEFLRLSDLGEKDVGYVKRPSTGERSFSFQVRQSFVLVYLLQYQLWLIWSDNSPVSTTLVYSIHPHHRDLKPIVQIFRLKIFKTEIPNQILGFMSQLNK